MSVCHRTLNQGSIEKYRSCVEAAYFPYSFHRDTRCARSLHVLNIEWFNIFLKVRRLPRYTIRHYTSLLKETDQSHTVTGGRTILFSFSTLILYPLVKRNNLTMNSIFSVFYVEGLKRSCWTTPFRSRSPRSPLTPPPVSITSPKLCLPLRSPKARRCCRRGVIPSLKHTTSAR